MAFQETPNVAQYKGASWDNLIKKVSGTTPEEARKIAFQDPDIDFFFYVREPMFLEGSPGPDGWTEKGQFNPGDAVFFSGQPWPGSAPQCDLYVKHMTTAMYAGGPMGPADIATNLAAFEASGFNTLILSLFHIGRSDAPNVPGVGDIIFNGPPSVVHDGAYQLDGTWEANLAQLKSSGKVGKILCSIGGANNVIFDFRTIQELVVGPTTSDPYPQYTTNGKEPNPYITYGTGPDSTLYRNFLALKQNLPSVDGIDLDNEETYWVTEDAMNRFTEMLIDIGFEITFCPYDNQPFWNSTFQTIYEYNPNAVQWWNLQCYAGGGSNVPASWASSLYDQMKAKYPDFDAAKYIVPGLAARFYNTDDQAWEGDCPDSMCTTFSGWTNENMPGGFIWNYDSILDTEAHRNDHGGCGCTGALDIAAYGTATNNGLNKGCGGRR